jgi:sugar (pentulose or hexulose) kinase
VTPRPKCALGIDVGTTNTKVALVEWGRSGVSVRARASVPTPTASDFARTLDRLVQRTLDGQPPPEAVGIASMAETGVPLDADGAPLGDWLRWDGHRAGREAEALARRLGREQLIRATGVRPSAKVPLAIWAWLRAYRPDVCAAMAHWAGAADLACLLLTGRLATDHTLAGRTMAYRRLDREDAPPHFDADLLAEVGLRPDQLPDVVAHGVAGTVGEAVAGLRAGIPVSVAGHDHAVGAYAAGVRRPGQVADSVGTAEAVLTVVAAPPDPVEVAAAGMSSVRTVDATEHALLAGSPAAGAFVKWWLEIQAAGCPAAELFAAVSDLDDEPSEVVVLPYLHGRQAPVPDPEAEVRIVGHRAEHTPAQLARAMLQGLCLQARWLAAEQERLAGAAMPADEPVIALGAPLLANPAWLRLKALVMPRPLRVATEIEPVAVGAAFVGAVRAGLVDAAAAVLDQEPVATGHRAGYDRALDDFVATATAGVHRGART